VNAETGETVTASDRGPDAERGPGGYPGHDVPWLQIIRLHQAVAVRTDRHFGLIEAQDQQSSHWSSLEDFQPGDLDGPWPVPTACIRSESFRSALGDSGGVSLFIGGPCVPDWAAVDGGGPARLQWRPLLYREVRLERVGGRFEMVPTQPDWSVNPQLPRLIERLEVCPDGDLEGLAEALTRMPRASSTRRYRPSISASWRHCLGWSRGSRANSRRKGPRMMSATDPAPGSCLPRMRPTRAARPHWSGSTCSWRPCCGRIPRIRVDCARSRSVRRHGVCRRRPRCHCYRSATRKVRPWNGCSGASG
jgi:hypothetical protein